MILNALSPIRQCLSDGLRQHGQGAVGERYQRLNIRSGREEVGEGRIVGEWKPTFVTVKVGVDRPIGCVVSGEFVDLPIETLGVEAVTTLGNFGCWFLGSLAGEKTHLGVRGETLSGLDFRSAEFAREQGDERLRWGRCLGVGNLVRTISTACLGEELLGGQSTGVMVLPAGWDANCDSLAERFGLLGSLGSLDRREGWDFGFDRGDDTSFRGG